MNMMQNQIMKMELVKGIVLLSGTIHDVSGYFALDTGATQTVLNKTYDHTDSDMKAESAITFDSGTQNSEITIADHAAISIGGENIALQNVPVMDMGYVETPLRETKPDLHFLGSLGGDMIGTERLIVDYIHKQVIFHATEIPANAKAVKMPVQKLPMVELKIRQKEFCFVLDTGANHFVMDQSVAPMDSIGVSSDKDAPHSIQSLTFAGREYKDVTGMITDLSAIRKELHVDGIIGYQLLKEYVCCFDYQNECLYLARE